MTNKFSIIMPTFNDCKTIEQTLISIQAQKYTNWELIIVNDGSNDESELIIKKFINEHSLTDKVKYFFQTNQGQLQSIKNAIPHICGDFVYILHSDDVFYDENVLENANNFFTNNNCDAIICKEIPTFNKDHNSLTGSLKVKTYSNKVNCLVKLLINNGSNLYMDMAFVKKDVFVKQYFYNYLEWNRPFWCNIEDKNVLNVKSVDFKFFRYRVFEENYIQSDVGKLVQINGELRTMTDLLSSFQTPFYKLQNFVYRLLSKFGLDKLFLPCFKQTRSSTKKVYKIIKSLIDRRLQNTNCINNELIVAMLNFYHNYTDNVIDLTSFDLKNFDIKGSDIRNFILKGNNEVVKLLIQKSQQGFNSIIVKDSDVEYAKNILHFMCILPYVNIVVK